MAGYIPLSLEDKKQMLKSLGMTELSDLFASIPEELLLKDELNLPQGCSEMETARYIRNIASKNRIFSTIFRGAGAYNHYIPAVVKRVTSKEEFLTAYTPYQAELSQGVLQSIFEFQTMICELTGMDVANASVYDGASAAAEATNMCCERQRRKIYVSESTNPQVRQVIDTYALAGEYEVYTVPMYEGKTNLEALRAVLSDTSACFYVQQPNFYGLIEDVDAISELVHQFGAKLIVGVNPIASALLRTPRDCGADIAVGEGQPLGLPLAYGGPYLGFMACSQALVRKLPGRIVGQTADHDGRQAFVLTLQAREQHIRRERASSNICSNQAHCALTASVYMSAMGPEGLEQVAEQCYAKSHYAAEQITKLAGYDLVYKGEFFHEFVTTVPGSSHKVLRELENRGILGGHVVENGLLWCVTEMNTKQQIDRLVAILKEVAEAYDS